jgi:hypothetical protein
MRRSMIGLAAVLMVAITAGLFAWPQSQKAQSLAVQEATAREEAESAKGQNRRFEKHCPNGRLYERFDVKAVYMVDASGFYALGRMSCVVWV